MTGDVHFRAYTLRINFGMDPPEESQPMSIVASCQPDFIPIGGGFILFGMDRASCAHLVVRLPTCKTHCPGRLEDVDNNEWSWIDPSVMLTLTAVVEILYHELAPRRRACLDGCSFSPPPTPFDAVTAALPSVFKLIFQC